MRPATLIRSMPYVAGMALLALAAGARAQQGIAPPDNGPATVAWDAASGRLMLEYHGGAILSATLTANDATGKAVAVKLDQQTDAKDDKVTQNLTFTPAGPGQDVTLTLSGEVTGSGEAFPAETESAAQQCFPLVRNSVGLSRSLRNNAVYDRRWDWVLSGPGDGTTRIAPKSDAENKRTFGMAGRGRSIGLAFCPRFYQKHQGYKDYEPWTYKVWQGSLTGYCTWWAYKRGFTQETLDAMLKVFVEKRLPDFGYAYMQFDDAYQQSNGSCPENWLNWNQQKFPGDWKYALKVIRDAGMKPGIWVHRIHRPGDPHVADIVKEHPDWFVRKADGALVTNRGFHMLDTTNKEAVDNMVRKLYHGLKEQGWEYVKIDGTGDLLRAYQNEECEDFFKTHPTTPEQSLRQWDIVAREELGRDVYIVACHTVGNARNVIGLVDGARLSNDGFQPNTLAQYNLLEGVVWRNDPDHCDVMGGWLMDENAMMPVFGRQAPVPARSVVRPALCAMAGAVLMVSDKVEVYQDDRNIEGMKRSAPVLCTVPGQLYGVGRRLVPWWLQEIDRPFDHWAVLARFQWGDGQGKETKWEFRGTAEQKVAFADLGLAGDRDYLVFEFWSQKFLGKCKGTFTAPAMDGNNGMQVFAIREARPHPWILSTTRHISQGGVDLSDVQWDAAGKTLSGKSAVVVGDPYVLTVHLPEGFKLAGAVVGGEKAEVANQKETATVRIVPSATRALEWKMTFAK
ncbi:MAG: alpha-galactosidase [Kiritimatiellaeota bacterium]|nr:alpha-galactosidase [Kiritimatiellota bacterium]